MARRGKRKRSSRPRARGKSLGSRKPKGPYYRALGHFAVKDPKHSNAPYFSVLEGEHTVEPNKTTLAWIRNALHLDELQGGAHRLPKTARSARSFVLHGPPGSGKTTVVESVARTLKWPLVQVTPSDFVVAGADNVESRLLELFSYLGALEKVVILFSEFDGFIRFFDKDREVSIADWLIASMLPRLSDLYAEGFLIFALECNDIDKVDRALTRPGRFDAILEWQRGSFRPHSGGIG